MANNDIRQREDGSCWKMQFELSTSIRILRYGLLNKCCCFSLRWFSEHWCQSCKRPTCHPADWHWGKWYDRPAHPKTGPESRFFLNRRKKYSINTLTSVIQFFSIIFKNRQKKIFNQHTNIRHLIFQVISPDYYEDVDGPREGGWSAARQAGPRRLSLLGLQYKHVNLIRL